MAVSSGMSRRKFLRGLGIFGLTLAVVGGITEVAMWPERNHLVFGEESVSYDNDAVGLMTYNIANARGGNNHFLDRIPRSEQVDNLDRIVSTILESDADVVGLNEVDFGSYRSWHINQARYISSALAEKWGVAYLVEGINIKIPMFTMGNALISRYPVKESRNNVFSWNIGRIWHEFKGYLDATVRIKDGEMDFVVTHLHAGSEKARAKEAGILADCLKKKRTSFVLLGDLNTPVMRGVESKEEALEVLLDVTGDTELRHLTSPEWGPYKKLDYIMPSADLLAYDWYTSGSNASDHLALGCSIRIQED